MLWGGMRWGRINRILEINPKLQKINRKSGKYKIKLKSQNKYWKWNDIIRSCYTFHCISREYVGPSRMKTKFEKILPLSTAHCFVVRRA